MQSNNLRRTILTITGFFILLAIAGGLLWANLNFVKKSPGGGDFYVLWQGTRSFSVDGNLPYGDLTRQIADYVYGLNPTSHEPLRRFSLPLYLMLFYIPFALIQDPLMARAVWMIFLEFELVGLVLLTFQLIRWKPAWFYLIILFLFGVFWAPAVASLFSGTLIIFQAVLLFGAIRAIEFNADEIAGALMALAWFNLEVMALLIVLVLFWAMTQRRWRVVAGFLMATVLVIGLSILFNTAWIFPFMSAIVTNWREMPYPSTYSLLESWLPGVGIRLAQVLTVIIAFIILMEWRAVRGKEVRWLVWTVSFTAVITPLLGVPFSPQWLVLSLPALLVVLSIMDQRWGPFGRWSAVALFLVAFFGLWRAFQITNNATFIFLFPALLIFLLYWVRWWAVSAPRLWADVISDIGRK
jgi:hypothetical protein